MNLGGLGRENSECDYREFMHTVSLPILCLMRPA